MKKHKSEAQAFAVLVNKLLAKEIREEDLRANPDKIEQYAKILDRSLSKIYDDWKPISDEETIEKKVDEILYYYGLLKFACVDEEKFIEICALWEPRVPEKLKEMGYFETFNEWDEQREELHRLRLEEDRLSDLISRLRKCEDEKCGKWFVQTAKNKRFCNRRCAAKCKQRMIRETDRKGFNKKHKAYYHENISKKGKKGKEEAQATLSKKHEEK